MITIIPMLMLSFWVIDERSVIDSSWLVVNGSEMMLIMVDVDHVFNFLSIDQFHVSSHTVRYR